LRVEGVFSGTEATLLATLPVFGLIALIGSLASRIPGPQKKEARTRPGLGEAFQELKKSDYLWWMLGLIVLVQVVITLIDYQYNVILESAYPDTDERTQVAGQVYASISVIAIVLQVVSGLLLRFLGVPAVLLLVPVLLGAAIAAAATIPRFSILASLKVGSKAFDYSLFKAAKEILYIPLTYAEKTAGKAAVDMFAYRFAKGGAALVVAALVAADFANGIPWLSLLTVGLWIAVTWRIVVGYRRKVSRTEEIYGPEA
ncbi:MAG: Npt1/Npt2 family nucleotide transporter, partial [Myxococcota bacterium]